MITMESLNLKRAVPRTAVSLDRVRRNPRYRSARVPQLAEDHSALELQMGVPGSSPGPRTYGAVGEKREASWKPEGGAPSGGGSGRERGVAGSLRAVVCGFESRPAPPQGGTLKKRQLASSLISESERRRGTVTWKELGRGTSQSRAMFRTMEVRALPVLPWRGSSAGRAPGDIPGTNAALWRGALDSREGGGSSPSLAAITRRKGTFNGPGSCSSPPSGGQPGGLVSPDLDRDRLGQQGAHRGQVPRRRPALLHDAVGDLLQLAPHVAVRWPQEGALEAAAYLQHHVGKGSTLSHITSRRDSSDGRAPWVRTTEAGDSIALLSSNRFMGPRGSIPRTGAEPGQVYSRQPDGAGARHLLTLATDGGDGYYGCIRSDWRLTDSFASRRSPPLAGRWGCIGGIDTKDCTPRVHIRVMPAQETITRWRRKCVGPLEGTAG